MLELFIGCTHTKLKFNDLDQNSINVIKGILEDKFTVRDSSLSYNPLVKRGIMTDKRPFYNDEYQLIPTGLIPYLKIYLKKENIEFKVNDTRKFPEVDNEFINQEEIVMGDYIARDYQAEALRIATKNSGNGKGGINAVLKLSTGSGKGMIAAMLCRAFPKAKILFVFDSIDLIDQTYRTFLEEYGINESEVGIIQGNRIEDDKRIVLLSMQSYEKAFRIFRSINVICCDEAHTTARTDTAEKIIYACQNASVKIGLTATPELENPYEQMRLFANIGPVLYKREVKQQIEVNAISPVDVVMYKIKQSPVRIIGSWADIYDYKTIESQKHKQNLINEGYSIITEDGKEVARKFLEYGDESNHYVNNEERNELIAKLAIKHKRVLLIFTRIDHGNKIFNKINELAPDRAFIVSGKDDISKRKEAIQLLTEKEDSIVLASNIFSKGIDVRPIETVIMCSGGKSSILVIQRVGRALRKSPDTKKTKAKIIDFYDETLSKIAAKQSEKRQKIYEGLEVPVKIISA